MSFTSLLRSALAASGYVLIGATPMPDFGRWSVAPAIDANHDGLAWLAVTSLPSAASGVAAVALQSVGDPDVLFSDSLPVCHGIPLDLAAARQMADTCVAVLHDRVSTLHRINHFVKDGAPRVPVEALSLLVSAYFSAREFVPMDLPACDPLLASADRSLTTAFRPLAVAGPAPLAVARQAVVNVTCTVVFGHGLIVMRVTDAMAASSPPLDRLSIECATHWHFIDDRVHFHRPAVLVTQMDQLLARHGLFTAPTQLARGVCAIARIDGLMLCHLFGFLDFRCLVRVARVSATWNQVSQNRFVSGSPFKHAHPLSTLLPRLPAMTPCGESSTIATASGCRSARTLPFRGR